MRRILGIVSIVGILGMGFCGLIAARHHLSVLVPKDRAIVSLPPLIDYDPRVVDMLFMGHKSVYDVLISVWITQILVDSRLDASHADQLVDFVRRASAHRPNAERTLYIGTCFTLMQKLLRPDLCFPINEEGMRVLPNSWMIPLTQGFVEGFVLKNAERAALFYFLASQKEDVPEYVYNVALKFGQHGYIHDEDHIRSLEMMLNAPGGERFLDLIKTPEIEEMPNDP